MDETTDRCEANRFTRFPDGTVLRSVGYTDLDVAPFRRSEARCPGCGVRWAEAHHPGCDVGDRCPWMGCNSRSGMCSHGGIPAGVDEDGAPSWMEGPGVELDRE